MAILPEPLITISPDIQSGEPVFSGTRVPVQAMLDYIQSGDPIEVFLAGFPSVSRDHAEAVLRMIFAGYRKNPELYAG